MKSKNIEFYFDSVYLLTALILGIALLQENMHWAFMAFILFLGDSTHLTPRIYQIIINKKVPRLIGYGKMITSITMTIFYVLLWNIGIQLFQPDYVYLSKVIYALCAMRIILCVLPQNEWVSERASYIWGIYRNIPFILQGVMVFLLYFIHRTEVIGIKNMNVAIFLSFAFYIPVVLGAHKNPLLGMLMLPKTICYVWIIAMGLNL